MNPQAPIELSSLDARSDFSRPGSVYEAEYGPRNHSALINATAILWRERKSVSKIALGGALLTLLIVLMVPNMYESTVRLMGPDNHRGSQMAMLAGVLGKAGGAINGLASDLLGVTGPGEEVMGVLRSRTVAQNIVDKFDLKKVYWMRKDSSAREKLADRTSMSEDRKTGIITVTVTDHDPTRAANMARAYIDQLNGLLNEVNTSAAHRERVFIEERLKQVKQELTDASVRLSDFSAKNTTLDPKEQGKAMVDAVVTLQGQLMATQAELKGLQQIYSENNVRVRSARARISELQRQLQDLHGRDVTYSTAENGTDNSLYPTLRQLPSLGLTYAGLYREVKLHEAVFETLTEQYELSKIEEAKEIPTVKVLDPPDVPDKKSGPPRAIITILGMAISFCMGSIWLVGRSVWREIDRNDPRKQLAFEVIKDTRPAYSRLRAKLHRDGNGTSTPSAGAAD
jgi:capsule polysaccharide export protein KpsE/RkpR